MEEAGRRSPTTEYAAMDAECKAVCEEAVTLRRGKPRARAVAPCTRTSSHEHGHHLPRGPARGHGRGDGPRRRGHPPRARRSAQYNGAYKVSQGLLEKYGPERVIDTPIIGGGLHRHRHRRGHGGPAAHRGVDDLQLLPAGHRPGHQQRGQDALHVRRPVHGADRVPRPQRPGGVPRRPALPGPAVPLRPRPRPEGRRPLHARRRARAC